MIFPKSIKDYLKSNPKAFFYTSLGAVIPDLDLFTPYHRAIGHSVFFPILIMLLAPMVEKLIKREAISKNLRIFGIFWITHLIYDTTFGPIALFYPIDPRFYDIELGLILILSSRIILPGGLFANIEIIDQRTGVDTFFVNWSSNERIAYFGSTTYNLSITDFFLHATIFFFYLYYVVYPYIKFKIHKRKDNSGEIKQEETNDEDSEWSNLKKITDKLKIKPSQLFTMLLLVLLSTTLFLSGPYHGKLWIDQQKDGSSLYVIQDNIQLLVDKTISVPENTKLEANLIFGVENFNYSLFVIELSDTQINMIKAEIANITQMYQNQETNFTEFSTIYQNTISDLLAPNNQTLSIVKINSTKTANLGFESDQDLHLLYGIYNWEKGSSFINSQRLELSWIVDISESYWTGFILFLLNLLLTIVYIVFVLKYSQSKRK